MQNNNKIGLKIVFMAVYLFLWKNALAAMGCEPGEVAWSLAVWVFI